MNQAPPLDAAPALGKLLLDLGRDVRRDLVIVRELHRVLRASLRERAQLVDVAEHVGERHESLDDLRVAAAVGALDLAAPRSASTLVIAAVSVVLPWSTCPIVPTFTCGLVRSNFCFAIIDYLLFL